MKYLLASLLAAVTLSSCNTTPVMPNVPPEDYGAHYYKINARYPGGRL